VKLVLDLIRRIGGIHGLVHITGGGFIDNIPRVLPETVGVSLKLDQIAVPPVFRWLARTGDVSEYEMLRTFNCGIGMALIVDAEKASEILAAAGDGARIIGMTTAVEAGTAQVVTTGALNLA
jgi:phosphoribosylformylglycinamidine cyclo-ligase